MSSQLQLGTLQQTVPDIRLMFDDTHPRAVQATLCAATSPMASPRSMLAM
jgi:hypothetical protein